MATPAKTLKAEEMASRYLADANEAAERGNHTKAEKLYIKCQYWLDRYNPLGGQRMTPAEIAEARRQVGLTQAQMAQALGYAHPQSISDLERGKLNPGKAVVLLLERMLEDAK